MQNENRIQLAVSNILPGYWVTFIDKTHRGPDVAIFALHDPHGYPVTPNEGQFLIGSPGALSDAALQAEILRQIQTGVSQRQ